MSFRSAPTCKLLIPGTPPSPAQSSQRFHTPPPSTSLRPRLSMSPRLLLPMSLLLSTKPLRPRSPTRLSATAPRTLASRPLHGALGAGKRIMPLLPHVRSSRDRNARQIQHCWYDNVFMMTFVLSYFPKSPKKKSTLCFPLLFSFMFSFASSDSCYYAPFSLCRVLRIKQLFPSDRLECQSYS